MASPSKPAHGDAVEAPRVLPGCAQAGKGLEQVLRGKLAQGLVAAIWIPFFLSPARAPLSSLFRAHCHLIGRGKDKEERHSQMQSHAGYI